jgi:CheY-like chemotaxis protein
LLLDVQMPGKSGFEVLQWIRNEPCLSTLRVIVLTGSVNKGDIKLAYKLGANSVLVKPTSFTCLTNMIQTLHKYWLSLSPAPEITRPGRS